MPNYISFQLSHVLLLVDAMTSGPGWPDEKLEFITMHPFVVGLLLCISNSTNWGRLPDAGGCLNA